MLRVAIIGSGPAGVYAADALAQHGGVSVDVLDRLPAPYGLVRYGVAPDHLKIKSIMLALQKVFELPAVRFLGNVEIGADLTLDDLRRHYDAVIFAHGAAVDQRMGVPGEDLPGSFSAREFVAWYSGHPDTELDRFTLHARAVAIVGVGNVAVDVARVLSKTAEELRSTDLPDHVLDVLARSEVTDVHMIGRRGPAQAKFTTKELRELGELANADVIVDSEELQLDAASEAAMAAQPAVRRNVEVLQEWSQRAPAGRARRLYLRFLLRPIGVLGVNQVDGLTVERGVLDGTGSPVPTGQQQCIDAQLLLRSVGYRGSPVPGLPFDERAGVVPNLSGRVLRDHAPAPGEYVAGWIKRGPTGVIGTNKGDAKETVAAVIADAPALLPAPVRDPAAVPALLAERGVDVVLWQGWRAIDAAERDLGRAQGRDRVKIADRSELLRAARLAPDPRT